MPENTGADNIHARNVVGLNDRRAPSEHPAAPGVPEVDVPGNARELGNNATLVLTLFMFLLFDLLAQCLLHLSPSRALEDLAGPASLAVTIVYARSGLITLGRKLIAGIKTDVA